MTIADFLAQAAQVWPGKPLTPEQSAMYGAKLLRFGEDEISKIFEYLTETAKYFPKIADIFDAARAAGLMERTRTERAHDWKPTDCRLCGGSGQLAVFFEQMFDPANGKRELKLQRIMQYESSSATARTQDWARYYFRCQCPAGDVGTLPKGAPRWTQRQREYRQLDL